MRPPIGYFAGVAGFWIIGLGTPVEARQGNPPRGVVRSEEEGLHLEHRATPPRSVRPAGVDPSRPGFLPSEEILRDVVQGRALWEPSR